jgi:ABC-type transporter Mla subunit MlaD
VSPAPAKKERIKMAESKTPSPADFTNLFLKGVEQAADLQKKSLEAALKQNAEALANYQKGASEAVGNLPNVFELAGKALESFIEAQKTVIDQIVQQTAALVESSKEGNVSAQKIAEMFAKNIEQSIERTVEVQKKALEMALQQAKAGAKK